MHIICVFDSFIESAHNTWGNGVLCYSFSLAQSQTGNMQISSLPLVIKYCKHSFSESTGCAVHPKVVLDCTTYTICLIIVDYSPFRNESSGFLCIIWYTIIWALYLNRL